MTYFGHEIERCRDYSSLHYRLPFEKVSPREYSLRIQSGRKYFFSNSGIPRGLGRTEGRMGRDFL